MIVKLSDRPPANALSKTLRHESTKAADVIVESTEEVNQRWRKTDVAAPNSYSYRLLHSGLLVRLSPWITSSGGNFAESAPGSVQTWGHSAGVFRQTVSLRCYEKVASASAKAENPDSNFFFWAVR